jgi:hypothetical protein
MITVLTVAETLTALEQAAAETGDQASQEPGRRRAVGRRTGGGGRRELSQPCD